MHRKYQAHHSFTVSTLLSSAMMAYHPLPADNSPVTTSGPPSWKINKWPLHHLMGKSSIFQILDYLGTPPIRHLSPGSVGNPPPHIRPPCCLPGPLHMPSYHHATR